MLAQYTIQYNNIIIRASTASINLLSEQFQAKLLTAFLLHLPFSIHEFAVHGGSWL